MSHFESLGKKVATVEHFRRLLMDMLPYNPLEKGFPTSSSWAAQNEKTQLLTPFETVSFEVSLRLFFIPQYEIISLDDDLFGTRAYYIQLKTLSARKSYEAGHTADVVSDAMFRIVFATRSRRRGESRVDGVKKLLDRLLDVHGENSLRTTLLTTDRGYGSEPFHYIVHSRRFSYMFIVSDQKHSYHTFRAASRISHAPELSNVGDRNEGNDSIFDVGVLNSPPGRSDTIQ